jgi:acyl carrier protein
MEHVELIRSYIVDNFLFGDDNDLQGETSFLDNGIIDSTGIIELVSYVEKSFNINVDDEDIVPENFDSIQKIAAYIMRRKKNTKN